MILLDPRCGNRNNDNPDCASHMDGDTFQGGDTLEEVKNGYREMMVMLKLDGWKKINGEWCCPSCVKHLAS